MAVADALVSKLLDMLVSTVAQEIEQEVRLVVGVKKQVKLLTNSLQSVQAVLIDAEKRQLKEATVQLWLERLKNVSYDIDDVLDKWSYAIMKSKIQGCYYDTPKPIRKVWSFILSSCFCFQEVGFRHDIAVKIKDLNERLDVIATEKDKYGFTLLTTGNNEPIERPMTTSVINISEVKGREVDKEKLVGLLLAESSEMPKLHLISIVGMGGIGKTTLAKLVYNDEMVETHFDKRIWVCVSEPFDEIRVAKAILESLIDPIPNLVELQSIVVKIQQSIRGKKFLLVLDDVWNEDPRKWKQLEDCLKCGSPGSKILVTTRKENVAKVMGCIELDIFRIGLLSKEECWSVFCEIAFSRRTSAERENLGKIGEEIVGRCKGLPLAVTTIAGLLRFKEHRREWESVLDSELWKLEEVERDILAPLWLSYYDLPSSLKQCFLYCVVFPKDYRMSEAKLINLWMAQGFLKATKDRDMEEIGHGYFHNLVMRSLFQDFEVAENYRGDYKTYCKMHDIVHDFAESVMKKECLSINVNSVTVKEAITMDATYSDLHHLHIKLGEEVQFLDSFDSLRKLRSLIVSPSNNNSSIGVALPKIFNELTCLRSLSLSRCGLESIPSNISKLIHLRWLKLSKNYNLKELPETICELYNLHTLSVNLCQDLERFPKGIEKLTNLRHLKKDYTYFLLPKGIGKLSGLRRLSYISIDPNHDEAFSLRDLKNLNNISGSLEIVFIDRQRNTLVEDAKQAELKEKKGITTLILNLSVGKAEWMKLEDEELVEALKPPPCLEVLRIYFYVGTNSPSWMSTLTCLKKLDLYDWSNCEHLPYVGNLPCLEYIEFDTITRVKKVSAEFFGMDEISESSSTGPLFPKLTTLKFINMVEWEDWNNYDGDEELMPCLSSLEVLNCPKLKALPNFILKKTTLKVLFNN